jgi:polyribonucleotide nucleotidyltransferase
MTNSWSSKHRVVVETEISGKTLSLETGWIAKQADGAVIVRCGDTMVLVTVCAGPARAGLDFFPLTVEYQERAYAAGKIPGGFFRREGKPAETEILSARLVDRPIRPLFPEGYLDDVQVICTVISSDGENSPDTLAIVGAGAALSISSLPFNGPVAGVRVGRIGGKLIANPNKSEMVNSDIDLVVAASRDAIVMVEGGAEFVPEAELLEALFFGHDEIRKIIGLQEQLKAKVGKAKQEVVVAERNKDIRKKVEELASSKLVTALSIKAKHERSDAVSAVSKATLEALAEVFPEELGEVKTVLHDLQYEIVRKRAITEKTRLDGRGLTDVRPIECETGLIPRAHGSALFTRGETQAIVTATLGTGLDAQRIDSITDSGDKTFMLHYNFPPYSTGESKPMRGTGRREIGHGALAERSVKRILPKNSPYVIRIVSDITESNGSSSMASVCGASLALMDAGIPVIDSVAGIAMGLVQEPDGIAILSDILGDEDHLGDMDFKVAGNKVGITGIQMDIKCLGLSRETMSQALEQARLGRLHILGEMEKAMSTAREEMSRYAPRMHTMKINPDKIRDVIGPGGKMIRSITDSTGVKIDIQDDGTVTIASSSTEASQRAIEIIKGLTEEAEIGRIYDGVVKRIADFGAFVEILPGVEGLVHISQLDFDRVNVVTDICSEGDEMKVRVIDIDKQGRIRLSRKEALESK